jgi:hypothetical protein
MSVGVYANVGHFPLTGIAESTIYLSLIRFTIWSSVVHAGIKGIQSTVQDTWVT